MIQSNHRLSCDDALDLLKNGDVNELGARAHEARLNKSNPDIVSYVVNRNINYTNICAAVCDFCAFYRTIKDKDGYVLTDEVLDQKVQEVVDANGTEILLQGGMHPRLKLDFYCNMLSRLKAKFPTILWHSFSAPEIVVFSKINKIPVCDILKELKESGLNTIPGGGAEILSDRVRNEITRGKCTTQEWLNVHEEAHKLGIRSSATMMFGHVETLEERVEHWNHLRELQDRTQGFTAFIAWTFQNSNTKMEHVAEAGAVEYLRTISVARLFLDNIDNHQASFITQGKQVGQMSLFYGCNDMGGTMMEENVVAATGAHHCSNEKEVCKLIVDAGFTPKKRNTLYEYLN
jgi:cyclic dehypoxanthinyl futalosine synthase